MQRILRLPLLLLLHLTLPTKDMLLDVSNFSNRLLRRAESAEDRCAAGQDEAIGCDDVPEVCSVHCEASATDSKIEHDSEIRYCCKAKHESKQVRDEDVPLDSPVFPPSGQPRTTSTVDNFELSTGISRACVQTELFHRRTYQTRQVGPQRYLPTRPSPDRARARARAQN